MMGIVFGTGAAALIVAALIAGAAGCGTENIRLAIIDGGVEGSGGSADASIPCSQSSDCPGSDAGKSFCQKNCPGFTTAAVGQCATIPETCPPDDFEPLCACDGFTYFNGCLARRNKIGMAYSGFICPPQFLLSCGCCDEPGLPRCGEGTCARILPTTGTEIMSGVGNSCSFLLGRGSCWILPDVCSSNGPRTFVACGQPSGPCIDPCIGAKDGGEFVEDPTRCHP